MCLTRVFTRMQSSASQYQIRALPVCRPSPNSIPTSHPYLPEDAMHAGKLNAGTPYLLGDAHELELMWL